MNQLTLFPDRNALPPEAISDVILGLASEEARYITGCAFGCCLSPEMFAITTGGVYRLERAESC